MTIYCEFTTNPILDAYKSIINASAKYYPKNSNQLIMECVAYFQSRGISEGYLRVHLRIMYSLRKYSSSAVQSNFKPSFRITNFNCLTFFFQSGFNIDLRLQKIDPNNRKRIQKKDSTPAINKQHDVLNRS